MRGVEIEEKFRVDAGGDDARHVDGVLFRMLSRSSFAAVTPGSQNFEGPVDEISAAPFQGRPLAIGGSDTAIINTPGDRDGFAVELVAGQSYVFTLTGSGNSPLDDPFLEIYSDFDLVAIDDDGGPGRNSVLRFTPLESGTYYINAMAWDSYDPADGPPTLTGGYTITADLGPPQNPLDTIDLGFVLPSSNISVYFATTGQSFNGVTALRSWNPGEINSALTAMATFSAVAGVAFTQTTSSAGATFVMSLAQLEPGTLGQFTSTGSGGFGVFDPFKSSWSPAELDPGGRGFVTLVHEIGHGLGLAHPHDNGGFDPNNSSEIMQGVTQAFDDSGTFGLNVGYATIMSYNTDFERGPGALDIALLQEKYGANTTSHSGNDVYQIAAVQSATQSIQVIWDVGGIDTIAYSGSGSVRIDLHTATLLNELAGAGLPTSVNGEDRGFVIAHGVVVENATGSLNIDSLVGNSAANTLDGGGSDDSLWGWEGADTLIGGDGTDLVVYQNDPGGVTVNLLQQSAIDGWGATDTLSGIENVIGSAFNDTLIGGVTGRADLNGLAGDDYIEDHSTDLANLSGGLGNDRIVGGSAQNAISGDAGDDVLSGGASIDSIDGGAGNDIVNGGGANDVMFGGSDIDTISYADATGAVDVSLALQGFQDTLGSGFDRIEGFENLTGSAFNDTLTGDAGDNVLNGLAGDDILVGGRGGVNVMNGGEGVDLLGFAGETSAVFVDLSAGAYSYAGGGWDALVSVEGVLGGAGNDTLLGDAGANLLRGGAGIDTLLGRDGGDTISGEAGDDWLDGGFGDDLLEGGVGVNVLIGGTGTDLASYASQTANLWIDMPAGVYSAAGVWDVFFQSIEGVLGGSGNDTIFGNALDNTLRGGGGDDALIGGVGNDRLEGGAGADWIVGGEGNDRLIGGEGVDVLTGGAGADTFDLGTAAGWDVAFDFNTAEDRFSLGGLSWLGFLTVDADGDGQADDTLLGYAGGNFVALNASGLSLTQWNALVDAPAAADAGTALAADEEITPQSAWADPLLAPLSGWWPEANPAPGDFTPDLQLATHAASGWGLVA